MKVRNMTSNRSGRTVSNQFDIVDDNDNIYFQSYDTVIVAIKNGKTYLDVNSWDYSRTTGKYRTILIKYYYPKVKP